MKSDPWMAFVAGTCNGVLLTFLLVVLAAWWGL